MKSERRNFKEILRKRLMDELPGLPSQMKMVPAVRRKEIENRHGNGDARKAAVLICFYPEVHGGIHLVLIRRNEYDGVHSGQISFPGGRHENDDSDLFHTALREAEEETNIRIDDVEVLGEISPVYIPPSNFIVKPVIGWTSQRPDLIPDPFEVSEILTVSLDELMDPVNRQTKNISHREFNIIDVPCFYIQGHIIWGATAMMLSEVVDVLEAG
ncbi:MAG: CoA pyrophosphatase [Bacteroidetes bacterium]|nr:MAG: CoA pyrophosphatase [Bacteroidota bacterium]